MIRAGVRDDAILLRSREVRSSLPTVNEFFFASYSCQNAAGVLSSAKLRRRSLVKARMNSKFFALGGRVTT